MHIHSILKLALSISFFALLAACGGGGSSATTATSCGGGGTIFTSINYPASTPSVAINTNTSYTPTIIGVPAACSSSQNVAVATGSLPPGVTLNTNTGVVSGAPTTLGTYTYSLSLGVTGYSGRVYSNIVTYTVTPALSPSISTTNATALVVDALEATSYAEDGRLIHDKISTWHDPSYWTGYTGAGNTASCSGGGTTNLQFVDADSSNTLTLGDYWVRTYSSCNLGGSNTYSGSYRSDLTALAVTSGNGPSWTGSAWTATVVATNAVTSSYNSGVSVGSYTNNMVLIHFLNATASNALSVTTTPNTFTRSYTASSGLLSSYGYTRATGNLTYATTIAWTGSVPYTKSGSMYVYGSDASSSVGGSYVLQLSYPTALSGTYDLGTATHSAPTTGVFKISGNNTSYATLDATTATTINVSPSGGATSPISISSLLNYMTP